MTTQETLKNRIATQIAGLKGSIANIDDHSDDSEFFYKLSQNVKWIAHDIDRIHSGYYIAIMGNMHYPLGFMTADQALERLEKEHGFDDYYRGEDHIKEVSPELYGKYLDLIQINELYDHIEHLKYELQAIIPDDFVDGLKAKIEQLRSDIGFEFRCEDAARICR